jgi:hypothetical protein
MPNRFIGDHGLALKLVFEDAKKRQHPGIGIAIDSAKAYDYVNEEYLCRVLDKFGFPTIFITTIRKLFFQNSITINLNGFLSKEVQQRRGLRQGGAILPILFNYALEPLLLAILNDNSILGYSVTATGKLQRYKRRQLHRSNYWPTQATCWFLQTILMNYNCYRNISSAMVEPPTLELIITNRLHFLYPDSPMVSLLIFFIASSNSTSNGLTRTANHTCGISATQSGSPMPKETPFVMKPCLSSRNPSISTKTEPFLCTVEPKWPTRSSFLVFGTFSVLLLYQLTFSRRPHLLYIDS